MRDEIVETMARQLAAINSPASQIGDNLIVYKVEAVCLVRALESAGYRIVRREPTEEMVDAMVTADRGKTLGSRVTFAYQAAFDAAPLYGEVGE